VNDVVALMFMLVIVFAVCREGLRAWGYDSDWPYGESRRRNRKRWRKR
jgi:hypothetical protein